MTFKQEIERLKFFTKYYWLVLTFRTPIIEYVSREFKWDSDDMNIIIDVLNISPDAIRNFEIVEYQGQLKLSFDYTINGSPKLGWISLHDVIYFGT